MSKDGLATERGRNAQGLGIAQNMAWNSIGNVVYLGAQWSLTFFVVRFLGYGPAGVFSLAMSVGNTVCALAAYSMRNFQASDVDQVFSDRQYVLSRVATSVVSAVATAVFVLCQPYDIETAICVMGYGVFKISEAFSDVYQAIQQKHLRMDYVGKAYILKSLLETVVFCLVILLTRSLPLAVCALGLISFAVILTYERITARRLAGSDYDRSTQHADSSAFEAVRDLLIACAPMAVYGVVFNTFVQVPRYQLEALCGKEALGIYASVAMPVTLVQIAANYLFTPLTTPMAMLRSEGDTKGFMRIFAKVTISILAVSVFAFIVAALIGEQVYRLMYGDSIVEYVYLMFPLIVCSVLTALAWFFANTLTVMRRLGILLAGSLLALVVALLAGTPFITAFGMNGASYACATALLVFVLVMVVGLLSAREAISKS